MSFNVGDQVTVVRRGVSFDENGMGTGYKWDNRWCSEMSLAVGKHFRITNYDQDLGYCLDDRFYFPENVLERTLH